MKGWTAVLEVSPVSVVSEKCAEKQAMCAILVSFLANERGKYCGVQKS